MELPRKTGRPIAWSQPRRCGFVDGDSITSSEVIMKGYRPQESRVFQCRSVVLLCDLIAVAGMVTGHEAPRSQLDERRFLGRADLGRRRTARMKRTSRRSIGRIRHVPTDDDALASRGIGVVQLR